MQNFKFITVILGLLSSFVTMAADNSIINDGNTVSLSGGTSTARVIAPKAIVYADENMLSPLGYIGNGKAVVVGSPRRMNRDLVPIVVYGRLAFIEVKDIRYEDTANEEYNMKRGAPREHNFDIVLEKPTEKLSINNSMFLSLHTYNAGEDVKDVFLNIDGADKTAMTGFAFQLIHRNEGSRIFWGAGVDYSSISTSNVQFAYWLVSPTLGYSFLRNKLFVLDLYASLDLAPNTVFEIENNYKSDPTGFVWGIQGNARIVLFPENRYHITGAIGLRKYSVSGISQIEDGNGVFYPGITGLTSVSLSLGLGFEFF